MKRRLDQHAAYLDVCTRDLTALWLTAWHLRFRFGGGKEPAELDAAGKFLVRHVDTMFEQLETNASRLKLQFEAIAVLDYTPSYEHATGLLKERMKAFRKNQQRSQT